MIRSLALTLILLNSGMLWAQPQRIERNVARSKATLAQALAEASWKDGELVDLQGRVSALDGGGGKYQYDSDSIESVDGVFVLPGVGGSMSYDANGVFNGTAGTGRFLVLDKTVVDVRRAGAVGDGSTDDSAAIQAAANACAAFSVKSVADQNVMYNRPKLVFPPTNNGLGYRTTKTINVNEGIDIDMQDRIVFDNASASPALVIGRNGIAQKNFNANLTVEVVRATAASSLDLTNDIGVRFINPYYCNIHIRGVFRWSIGAQLLGTNGSSALYNQVTLGAMRSCHIMLDLRGDGGACNENVFYGGRFNSYIVDGSNESFAVRMSNAAGSIANTDNNYFVKPSFELNPGSGIESFCFLIQDTTGTVVQSMRSESNGTGTQSYARFTGTSVQNLLCVAPGGDNTNEGEDLSATKTNYILTNKEIWNTLATTQLFHIDELGSKANYYDGATNIFVPGLSFATAADTSVRKSYAAGAVSIGSNGVTLLNLGLGRVVDTTEVKTFILDYKGNDAAAVWVKCFDAAGAFLEPDGQTYASYPGVGVTSNIYYNSGDNRASMPITFSDAVKSAWIGVTDVTDLESFTITSWDADTKVSSTSPGYDSPRGAMSLATTIPTSGTYIAGHTIYKDGAVEGDVQGWVCTESGTPGTWIELARVGTQYDYFVGGVSEKRLDNAGTPHLGATTNWEIEARVYRTGGGVIQTIYAQNDGTNFDIQLRVNAGNFIQLFFGGVEQKDGSIQVPANTWSTVKATRTGNTYELFVNDVSAGTHTEAGSVDQTYNTIGGNGEGGSLFQGYIDWVKVTNNAIEVYNVDFKSPIAENYFAIAEVSTDFDDPPEGSTVIWQSDGTGTGEDGDVLMKVTAASNTITHYLTNRAPAGHAQISIEDNATATTVSSTQSDWSAKSQFTLFGTNFADSSNATPDHTNDHITLTSAGVWEVTCVVTLSGSVVSDLWELALWKNNGATQVSTKQGVNIRGAGLTYEKQVTISGLVDASANDTIELWVQRTNGTGTLTITNAVMTAKKVSD